MNRLSHIFVCAVLSILVVWTGAGIGMLRCEHSGGVQMAVTYEACHGGASCGEPAAHGGRHATAHDKCCKQQKGCMHLSVLKLQPSVPGVAQAFSFTALPAVLALPPLQAVLPACPVVVRRIYGSAVPARHGPPRLWLAIIRVLQI